MRWKCETSHLWVSTAQTKSSSSLGAVNDARTGSSQFQGWKPQKSCKNRIIRNQYAGSYMSKLLCFKHHPHMIMLGSGEGTSGLAVFTWDIRPTLLIHPLNLTWSPARLHPGEESSKLSFIIGGSMMFHVKSRQCIQIYHDISRFTAMNKRKSLFWLAKFPFLLVKSQEFAG